MHLNSELLFSKHALPYFKDGLKVLEIGPQRIPSVYQKIINNSTITWHTLDLAATDELLTFVSEKEYEYPISSGEYDIIVSGQVMEHVKKVWTWLKELKRIVKRNGVIVLIVPVSWPYHEFPVDCWRIYPDGMRALSDDCGLDVLVCECESIEATHFAESSTPTIPGQSYALEFGRNRLAFIRRWNAILNFIPLIRKFRIPIEVAHDTIAVLKRSD